ncbi:MULTISPECIES: TIGR01244 family sulfur transferase [unclassified Acinetobacter]|uniref:TIGR01244 family sulfur transferase n=1 Tax=unclassified Acinetobacter TaxID=196816 RepID=UPI0035BB2730
MQEKVSFAGQILPEQMPQVVEQGFRSVINNRPDMEGGADQPTSAQIETAARAAGLDYVFQPVVPGQITEFDVRTFANHFNELPKPILMFCRTGNRSNNLFQLAKEMDLLDGLD